ncbi:MAG: hypothetical protein JWP89_6913 [Schlesneria sp.]|nr:hypothetical protein [Schlesneria sp.]
MNDLSDALQSIKSAWSNGRLVVPLIGAGFSVDSGMPVAQGVEGYLAQLHLYLKHALYLGDRIEVRDLFGKLADTYRLEPEMFVRDLQWPDRFVLHQHLCVSNVWQSETRGSLAVPKTMHDLMGLAYLELFAPAIGWKQDHIQQKSAPAANGHLLHSLFGDWRTLINKSTGFNVDLGEALIQRLHARRRPGTSHQYLAFLARLNVWQLILTFNFDQFIERSMTEQQLPHRVFGMEYGETFPDQQLVDGSLAIVKMHGDTHRLLMDQRLDRPLGSEYLQRLDACLVKSASGVPPLFVVLGCGGTEERCLSLVRHFCKSADKVSACSGPLVVWVHYEPISELPLLLDRCLPEETRPQRVAVAGGYRAGNEDIFRKRLIKALKDHRIDLVRAKNPGYFLMHLYSFLTTRHPSSRVPYLAHVDRPIMESTKSATHHPRTIVVFDGYFRIEDAGDDNTASQKLADHIHQLVPSCYPIWIDVEDCYSVVDIVGRIVEQARRYDTNLAPGVFELDVLKDDQLLTNLSRLPLKPIVIRKAVDRVCRILSRGTFCIAFDAVEAVGWPPTTHHGEVKINAAFAETHRVDLMKFLSSLVARFQQYHGSSVAVAINPPSIRYADERDDKVIRTWSRKIKSLRSAIGILQKRFPNEVELVPVDATSSKPLFVTIDRTSPLPLARVPNRLSQKHPNAGVNRLVLFRLTACRRTRQLVALRRLLQPLVGDQVDKLLDMLVSAQILHRLEGGGFWMNRPLRDAYYSQCTSHTSPTQLAEVLAGTHSNSDLERIVAQLWLAFAEHDRWADWYFDQNHQHSKDPHAFFEYIYHRVTSLRLITVVVALAARDPVIVHRTIKQTLAIIEKASSGGEQWFLRSVHEIFDDINASKGARSNSRSGAFKQGILVKLNSLRQMRLRWLAAVWRICGDDLALTTGAERCILWIRWLVTNDLKQIRHPLGNSCLVPSSTEMGGTEFNSREYQQELGALADVLLRLWHRLAFNRMDYRTALQLIRLQSGLPIGCEEMVLLEGSQERAALLAVQKWRASGALAIFGNRPPKERVLECLESAAALKCLGQVDRGRPPQPWTLEARVTRIRMLLDADECGLLDVDGDPLLKRARAARDRARELISYCDSANDSLHEWLSAHDAGDYEIRMQHAWLLISAARLQLMRKQPTEQSFSSAYRDLEAARSLVQEGPSHFRGIIEIYSGKISLQHVEFRLLQREPLLREASGKLRAAEAALTRAHALLREGRRNTRWWREFFNLEARLVCWQLCHQWFGFSLTPVKDERPLETRELLSLPAQKGVVNTLRWIRRGLSAIRRRSDLQGEPVISVVDLRKHADPPHLIWLALFRLGYSVVLQLTRIDSLSNDAQTKYKNTFIHQFVWYTKSVGFKVDLKTSRDLELWAKGVQSADLLSILSETRRMICGLLNHQ